MSGPVDHERSDRLRCEIQDALGILSANPHERVDFVAGWLADRHDLTDEFLTSLREYVERAQAFDRWRKADREAQR